MRYTVKDMIITSCDNAKVAEVTKLYDKKYRRSYGKYVIEGERLVNDAVKYGAEITSVFVRESAADSFDYDNQIAVSDKVFAKMCDTVSSQGVLAVALKPSKRRIERQGSCLILDGLQDPGNVGTLLRTAAACGFTDVYAVNCVDVYSPKVLRSAMSAHFCLNLHESVSLAEVFESLDGTEIIACDMSGENAFVHKYGEKVALVLGNEGNGLSEYSKTNANSVVSLPMANDFESLNVAVAGSVIMYQVFSQSLK